MSSKDDEIHVEEAIVLRKLKLLREFCKSHHGDLNDADQNDLDVKCDDFCKAFELCTTIEVLHLDNVKCTVIGPANSEKIANVVSRSKSLMYLFWRNAEISDQDAAAIARAFSKHCNLEYLFLGRNNIGDSGAKDIATMLTRNDIVKSLDLRGNSYGDSGARYLVDALLQNHNCSIHVDSAFF